MTVDDGLFFVSYHGAHGNPPSSNVYAYDSHGNQLSAQVLQVEAGTQLDEIRGMYLHQGYLYVANAGQTHSQVLCFRGAHTTYVQQPGNFITHTGANSIEHPFALAFGNGACFVSNQNTNVVARLSIVSPTTTTVVNGAAASYLTTFDPTNTFLDGTFVASAKGALPNVAATTPVPSKHSGLKVKIAKGKVQHSVRDIVLAGPGNLPNPVLLYVADEPANLVRLYDPVSGEPRGISTKVKRPTHLLVHNGVLYVSARHQLFRAPLVTQPGNSATEVCLDLKHVNVELPPQIKSPKAVFAGMTVDAVGNFYLALRTKRMIVKFANGDFSQPSVWLQCPQGAKPEFIVYLVATSG